MLGSFQQVVAHRSEIGKCQNKKTYVSEKNNRLSAGCIAGNMGRRLERANNLPSYVIVGLLFGSLWQSLAGATSVNRHAAARESFATQQKQRSVRHPSDSNNTVASAQQNRAMQSRPEVEARTAWQTAAQLPGSHQFSQARQGKRRNKIAPTGIKREWVAVHREPVKTNERLVTGSTHNRAALTNVLSSWPQENRANTEKHVSENHAHHRQPWEPRQQEWQRQEPRQQKWQASLRSQDRMRNAVVPDRGSAAANWQNRAVRTISAPARDSHAVTPYHGRTLQTVRFKTISLDGQVARAFGYADLGAINPVRKKIFDIVLSNASEMLRTAYLTTVRLSTQELTQLIHNGFGFCNGDKTIGAKMHKLMAAFHHAMMRYENNREKISFYSYADVQALKPNVVGVCVQGEIYLNDRFFEKNPVWQVFIFIHELAHVIGAKDRFYFTSNIAKGVFENNKIVRKQLLELPITEAFSFFINFLRKQVDRIAHRPSEDLYDNADTLTLFVFYLFNTTQEVGEKLEDSGFLINRLENKEAFPSLN